MTPPRGTRRDAAGGEPGANDGDALTEEDYRALAAFRAALRRFLRFSEEAARAEGLTPHQHQLLLAVRGWPGDEAPSIGDLAEVLALRHHSTAELIHRAEVAGLVVVRRDPTDRRRARVALRPPGQAVLARLSVLHRDELRRIGGGLADLLGHLAD